MTKKYVQLSPQMRTALYTFLAALLFLLPGCGSLSERWNGHYGAYPGVRFDVQQTANYTTSGEWIAVFDIPLSALLDTLCLPYDISHDDRLDRVTPSNDTARASAPLSQP